MTYDATADEAKGNERLKELHAKLPEARLRHVRFEEDPFRRWKVYSRLKWSVDGTTDESTAVSSECLIAEAPTWWEALARAHRIADDPKALLHFRERHIRGLPTNEEPPPLTPEERAEETKMRAQYEAGRQRAVEGMRAHLRGMLKTQGLEGLAKRYHKKTGRLPNLFGKFGQFFDVGKR